jgi:DNA invertase Pin-like site-specific DNA recombinase
MSSGWLDAPRRSKSTPRAAVATTQSWRKLSHVKAGDTLVVVSLDRLARSLFHPLAVIEGPQALGALFRSLRDPVDTANPQGLFTLQVLGAATQLEREAIATTRQLTQARCAGEAIIHRGGATAAQLQLGSQFT